MIKVQKTVLKLLRRLHTTIQKENDPNLTKSEAQKWTNRARGLRGSLKKILPDSSWLDNDIGLDTIRDLEVIVALW